MNLNNIMIAMHLVCMIVATGIGFITLTRMKSEKREYFVLFLFCAAIYALGFVMEATATTADGGLLSAKFGYIGSTLYAPMLLAFIQKYCEKDLPKPVNFLVFASAFAIIVLVWTIEFHSLFYTSYWYDDVSPVHHLEETRGVLYPLGKIHPAICMLLSVHLLIGTIRSASPPKKKRLLILMTCAVTPAVAQLTSLLNVSIFGWNDFQLLFVLAGIFAAYFGIAKYDLMENEEVILVKREFLQDMSHEMKSPLTVIATGIDYTDQQIREEKIDVPKSRAALGKIRNETQRLGRMVESMVHLSVISEKGENRKRVNFALLLESGAEAFRLTLEKRNNTLTVQIAPDLPDVFVEKDKFTQVIANLFSNAAKHTRGGRVFLTADFDHAYITVRMADTGDGVSPAILPRVFQRGVSGKGGTGYGLYICKTIVEAHGGTIEMESDLGKGTAVTFSVPVYGGQEAGHAQDGRFGI